MAEGLFSKDMTLMEMDSVLEKALSKNRREIRILADLPLSEGDYNLLVEKLTAVKGNMTLVQRYRISVVAAWVFALHYEYSSKVDCRYIIEERAGVPQYSFRQFIDICNSVFVDYGVAMYFSEIHNEQELYTMVVAHAGIPDQISEGFCMLLEELIQSRDIEKAMRRMDGYADGQLRNMADLSSRTFLENLVNTAASIMRDCRQEGCKEEDLCRRYPLTSSRLIHLCVSWVEKRNEECA